MPNPFYVINTSDYSIALSNSAAKKHVRSGKAACYALMHNRKTPCAGEYACVIEEVKKPIVVEQLINDKDKGLQYVEVHGFPIFDEKGDFVQLIEDYFDITERKKTQQDLQLFRDLMNQSNDAVFIIEPKTGHFLDVNNEACRSLGYISKELLDMKVVDIEVVVKGSAS